MKFTKKNLAIALIASSISLFALIPILIGTRNKNKNILYILGALASVQGAVGCFILSGLRTASSLSHNAKKKKRSFCGFDKDEYEIFTYDEVDHAEKMILTELHKGQNGAISKQSFSTNSFTLTDK